MAGETSWTDDADRVADRERVSAAVELRRRERWRRERQVGWTTTAAALSAALGSAVTVHLVTGTSLNGRVLAVGPDVVDVLVRDRVHHVALAAIAATELTVRPGDDPPRGGPTLLEVLDALRGEPEIRSVTLVGGTTVRGQVVGADPELVLRDTESDAHIVVPLEAIVAVT